MNDDVMMRERLSALADGELQGDEFAQAMEFAGTPQGQASWRAYHMIGDALRCSATVRAADPALLERLRAQIAQEPRLAVVPGTLVQVAVPADAGSIAVDAGSIAVDAAANASVFRWKMVAGFASLAAVAALGWNAYVGLGDTRPQGAQLAAAQPLPPSPQQGVPASNEGQAVMIRDPRLDELLAAHKQFGSTSALQMPADFLRNATFEAPAR